MSEDGTQSPVKKRNLDGEMANAALHGETDKIVRLFGSAAREHYAAYAGRNHEVSNTHGALRTIVEQKEAAGRYRNIQLKQQAGFAAEIKSVARRNAGAIINGDNERYIREDDRTGVANDRLVDINKVDAKGETVSGGAEQMKFVGSSHKDLLRKLQSEEYQRYFEGDVVVDIADDDYAVLIGGNGTPGLIDQRLDELNDLLENASPNKKAEIQGKIDKLRTIKSKLRKSGLTRREAMEAVQHPKWATVKDVIGVAHKAGVQQALNVAAVTGAMSLV